MKDASIVLALLAVAGAGSCDPVLDDARSALGDEAPGVATGPLHRPGQPCLVCHDGALGDPPAFSVAGTLYLDAQGLVPVPGATLTLLGADMSTSPPVTTNDAGNFFWTSDTYLPPYPIHVSSITVGNVAISMHSHIGAEGSCAGCHVDPPGPDSPGHVYFNVPPGMTP